MKWCCVFVLFSAINCHRAWTCTRIWIMCQADLCATFSATHKNSSRYLLFHSRAYSNDMLIKGCNLYLVSVRLFWLVLQWTPPWNVLFLIFAASATKIGQPFIFHGDKPTQSAPIESNMTGGILERELCFWKNYFVMKKWYRVHILSMVDRRISGVFLMLSTKILIPSRSKSNKTLSICRMAPLQMISQCSQYSNNFSAQYELWNLASRVHILTCIIYFSIDHSRNHRVPTIF